MDRARELLEAVVKRWTSEYHCCVALEHGAWGTGVPTPHSWDCPLEAARVFLEGNPPVTEDGAHVLVAPPTEEPEDEPPVEEFRPPDGPVDAFGRPL
jgi:hypothetical protein